MLEYEKENGVDSLEELIENARKLNAEKAKQRAGACLPPPPVYAYASHSRTIMRVAV